MTRSTLASFLLASIVAASSTNAVAGPYGDDLSKCLVNSSSTEDKQALVQWMFFAIALNPNAASYAKIADSERDTVDKSMAALLERLLTSTCLAEAKKAVKYEGDAALSQSFKLLGEVAATEMFGNPAVSAGTQKFLKYLDSDKLANALGVGAAQ